MTPDNGRVQVQFSEKREGAAGDTERQEAKKKKPKTARGRRREMSSVRVKDEAGREME